MSPRAPDDERCTTYDGLEVERRHAPVEPDHRLRDRLLLIGGLIAAAILVSPGIAAFVDSLP